MRSSRGSNTVITRSDASAQAFKTFCSRSSRDTVICESSVVEQPAPAHGAECRATSCDDGIATESPAALPTGTSTREVSCKTRDEDNNPERTAREVASDANDPADASGEAWFGVPPPTTPSVKLTEGEKTAGNSPRSSYPSTQQRSDPRTPPTARQQEQQVDCQHQARFLDQAKTDKDTKLVISSEDTLRAEFTADWAAREVPIMTQEHPHAHQQAARVAVGAVVVSGNESRSPNPKSRQGAKKTRGAGANWQVTTITSHWTKRPDR
ncbi:hypothetical protein ON010_g7486 [Phytophthora cinnamomi]|nr:hypothetical protein ON010_g7486 [Phytophthora cinnamomi]